MNDKICRCCQDLSNAIERYIVKAEEELISELSDIGYADAKATVEGADTLEEDLASVLTDQTGSFVEALEKAGTLTAALEMLDGFFLEDDTRENLQDILEQYYNGRVADLANIYIQETDAELEVKQIRRRTSSWISEWSGKLSALMQLSSKSQLEDLLKAALENGEGVAELSRRLMQAGIRNEEWQARRVALTEMLRAHNVANQEAMVQSPSVVQKIWRHTGRYKIEPRKNHVAMNGQIVLADKPFKMHGIKGGIYYPMYPMDPVLPPEETISCHCISEPIVDDDVLGMSLEERQALQQKIIEEDDEAWKAELDARNKAKAGIVPDEHEASKPKYDSEAAVIDRKKIASADYRNQYNNLPENKKIQRKVCANARKMLRHRSGTEYEDLAYINSKTGDTMIRMDYNARRRVIPSRAMKKMLKDADDYTIISVHNHPHSNVPSLDDLCSARDKKYKYGIVACHDGTVYKYSAHGEVNEPMAEGGLDLLERVKYIKDDTEREKTMERALSVFKDAGIEMEVL